MALVPVDHTAVLLEGAVLGFDYPVRCLFCLSPVVLYPTEDTQELVENTTALCPCCGTMYSVALSDDQAGYVQSIDLVIEEHRLDPETTHALRNHFFGTNDA